MKLSELYHDDCCDYPVYERNLLGKQIAEQLVGTTRYYKAEEFAAYDVEIFHNGYAFIRVGRKDRKKIGVREARKICKLLDSMNLMGGTF